MKFAVLRRAEAVEAVCPQCPTGEELWGFFSAFGEALGKAAGHGWLGSSVDGGRAVRRIPPGAVLLSPVPSPSLLGRSRGGHKDPGLMAPQDSEPRQVQGCSQRRALLSGSRWIQSKVGLFALLK